MAISIQLPAELERQLRADDPKIDEHARDEFLIAQYREGRISTGDIALVFGFETRYEAEEWLAARGVNQNYSSANLEADRHTLDRLLGSGRQNGSK